MEGEDSSGSGLYRPCTMEAENRSCDGIAAAAELPSVDECEPIDDIDDSQLVGVSGIVSVAGDEEVPAAVDVEVKSEVEVRERRDGKRKRGRPPKDQARPAPSKKKKEDEDVCFICFDGGSLVLCDRRGCPKAYHPACIKRDEAFFRSRAKWNCGWHICNSCQKAAHYMCYTCTYSLCKACTKDADYFCVRENKGFCTTCMRTIMLIENNDQGNKETAQVDFDDKSSWEYLFKVYWIYLKGKLSLTLDDLTQAQNPWKAVGMVVRKGQSLDVHYGGSYGMGSISESPSGHLGVNSSKRRRTKEQPKLPNKGISLSTDKSISDNGNTSVGSTEWASKELLEFAAHMRNGEDRRPHKNLDEYAAINVHNINLIYLRRNLMESLMVDKVKFHDKVVGSIVRIRISSGDQKQDMHRLVQVVGTCKVAVPYKIGERTTDVMLEILNLDKKETISIDAISNLEFSEDECRRLRECIKCGLVERLTVGQVQDKVMALQEARLNDWLETEIMRLNHLRDRASEKGHKKELRECVEKLELLKTTEEHQCRPHEIPEVHVDPKMDPNYESDEDAGVISNKKQDEYVKPRSYGFSRNGREPISPQNGDISKESGSRVWKKVSTCDLSRSMPCPFHLDEGAPCTVVERMNESSWKEGKNACGSNTLEKPGNQVDSSGSVVGGWNNQAVLRSGSFSGVVSENSVASLSTGSAPSADDNETDKLWHYRDPNGKIQGPFCMVQLREWNATGLFPPDTRIWSINDEEGNSLLLTDAVANSNCNNEFVKDNGWGSHSSNWTTPVVNNNDVQTRSSSQCWDSLKVKKFYSDQPQVQCPIPSSAFTEQPHETSLHQARGHEGQRWNSALNHGNWSSHGNGISQSTGGQSHENQCNSQGYSGQSSGESWRPLPVNYSSNKWDSNSGFASVAKPTDSSELNIGNDIPNMPSTTPKTSNADLEGQTTKDQQLLPSNVPVQDSSIQNMPSVLPKPAGEDDKIQAIENKQSVSSNFAVQDSGPSWSSASSVVVGCGTQLPEIADEWGGAKPSVDEWDSGLVSVSSLKPPEVASDHAATPTSKFDEITPSPSHPASNASSWPAIVAEPIEFSTLAEESVSDLLAEVDAMESQCGLASPTLMMNYSEELFQDPKADCFTTLGELSPPLDSGKSDALSSTGDIQLPPQLTMTDEPLGASQADIFDRSGGQSSASTEMEVETKPTGVPVNQSEAGSNSQLPAPSTMSQDTTVTDTAPRARAKPVDTGCGTLQGNMKSGWGGSTHGITNMGLGTDQGIARGNANMSASAGFLGQESHPKYVGERFMGPRDGAFQTGDSGFGRGRPSWSRQSSIGAGGGGYSRPSPKGQRVCKFYINGHCKKGAFCDYLHPS